MPPPIDDANISVRFKHGIHTIFLFVDALAPFSAVTDELLVTLRERYPAGLTTSSAPPKHTSLPEDARLAYAVLNVPTDPSKGWKRLQIGDDEDVTPTKCGLRNNSVVAFNLAADDVVFEVEWPREDEELYEQGGSERRRAVKGRSWPQKRSPFVQAGRLLDAPSSVSCSCSSFSTMHGILSGQCAMSTIPG
ncbi:hypothetical protein XA68_14835 [Ophiocordyceps unilateralis]|uniref:Uncharacterized protein n=1 Tax=Ophiocordyceps unilateralis TaxID=268505 RepID=A0A2A9PMX0_OPHUN|nr:hypothetical protein XA68_14835 [Ophiocordyceps unilateralis]